MGLASGRNKVRVGMPFRNALPSFPRPRCVHEKERRVFKTRKRHANKNKRVQPQRAVVCPSNDQGCTALSGCILFCNGTLSSECFFGNSQLWCCRELEGTKVTQYRCDGGNNFPCIMAATKSNALPCTKHVVQLITEKTFSVLTQATCCLLYTSPSPRDGLLSRMPSSA